MLKEMLQGGTNDARQLSVGQNAALVEAKGNVPAMAATLGAWHLLNLAEGTYRYLDAMNDPDVACMWEAWVYGWGFSFIYTKSAWEFAPFAAVTHAEDVEFMKVLRDNGVPVALPREDPGFLGLCAHTHHPNPAANTSGGEGER